MPSTNYEAQDVVVGAGAGGCVVAQRLAAAGRRVLLLEAGRDHSKEQDTPRFGRIQPGDDWNIHADLSAAQGKLWLPRGRVVGGTSVLQAGIALRAPHADYQAWAERIGQKEPQRLLTGLEAVACDENFPRRQGGLLHIERARPEEMQPIHAALVQSCLAAGRPWRPDLNGSEPFGIGLVPLARAGGRRQHARNTFLAAARGGCGLQIVPHALATRLRMRSGRVCGVELAVGNGERRIAHGERVIVAAGAIGTPLLLLASGIGPPADLQSAAIPVLHPLSAVGATLRDHPSLQICLELEDGHGQADKPFFQVMLRDFADSGALRARATAYEIFHDFVHAPSPMAMRRAIVAITLLDATGSGCVRLQATNPAGQVRLGFDQPDDLRALQGALDTARHLLQLHPFRRFGLSEPRLLRARSARQRLMNLSTRIGRAANQDGEEGLVANHVISAHHLHGSCPMGIDPQTAVADASGRVFGLDNLYLADASIIPVQLRANTHLTTLAIAAAVAENLQP